MQSINPKIIHVANIVEEAKLGGPQLRIASVAAALNHKVKTTVIMPKENSEPFRNKCDQLGIHYKCFWMSRITKDWKVALRYIVFFPYEVIQLARFFKKEDFDLIHVSGGSWQYKGVIAGKLAGKKVLWHLNDAYMPSLFRYIFKKLSFMADGYIYSATRSKEYYQSFIKKNKPEFIIAPPVDTTFFNSNQNFVTTSPTTNWDDKTVIGTVANINPIKGIELLIQSAALLNKQYSNLVFVIVGPISNTQKKYYRTLLQMSDSLSLKNIEFIGGFEDVRPIIQKFDIYVCTSLSETGPMSLFEAMSMEKAIISTDVGDVLQYINNSNNGFIIDVGDYQQLANQLSILITDDNMRQSFGIKARTTAIEYLDIKICAEKHNEAYKKIVSFN